jgi:hypothetical protein
MINSSGPIPTMIEALVQQRYSSLRPNLIVTQFELQDDLLSYHEIGEQSDYEPGRVIVEATTAMAKVSIRRKARTDRCAALTGGGGNDENRDDWDRKFNRSGGRNTVGRKCYAGRSGDAGGDRRAYCGSALALLGSGATSGSHPLSAPNSTFIGSEPAGALSAEKGACAATEDRLSP